MRLSDRIVADVAGRSGLVGLAGGLLLLLGWVSVLLSAGLNSMLRVICLLLIFHRLRVSLQF